MPVASTDSPEPDDVFPRTHWSVVHAAGGKATEALNQLCEMYRQPIYAFLCKQRTSREDADDLAQGFFAHLLKSDTLERASSRKTEVGEGKLRFRIFLLSELKRFRIDQWRRQQAEKRGGGKTHLPLHEVEALEQLLATIETPDQAYDVTYVHSVLQFVTALLKAQLCEWYGAFWAEKLLPCLTGEDAESHAAIAAELGISVGALRQHVLRMREQFQKLLRREIAKTVATATDIDKEIADLMDILRQSQKRK